MSDSIEDLKNTANNILLITESLIEAVKEEGIQNEQWFLDYLDRLNELSVSY